MPRSLLRSAALAAVMCAAAHVAAFAEDGVTDTTIRIGDVTIRSGQAKFLGDGVVLGSKIAAAEINANGGVNGRMIEIVTEDDGYVPARSFEAAKKLIEVDKVFAIGGTSGSSHVLSMMPLFRKHNVPVVVTTAPNKLIYQDGPPPSVFTLGADYSEAFYAQLKYIHEQKAEGEGKYALIRQDDDFGQSIEDGYMRAVNDLGLDNVEIIRFKRGQKDFFAEMAKLREKGVNVIANGAIFSGTASILDSARRLGMTDLMVATVWSARMPITVKLATPSGIPYLTADYVATRSSDAVVRFRERAAQFVSEEELVDLNRYTLVTYLGLKALAEAMEACGQDLTRACTIENLRKIENMDTDGLMAPISFNNDQQLSGTAVAVYQFDPGSQTFKTLTGFEKF